MNIYKCLNYGKKNYTSVFSKALKVVFQFILREHLYLNLKWWTNSYFIQVMIKNHAKFGFCCNAQYVNSIIYEIRMFNAGTYF